MELFVDNISKVIRGRTVLDGITLRMTDGHIYGFVGPNGSGKTMLFRVLSGLVSPTKGSVFLDGKKLKHDFAVLPSLGIVLENVGLYPNLTGFQNLSYLSQFKDQIGSEEIEHAMFRVGLDPKDKRSYRKYSLGMKQRLAIAQAIMERPDILMLDEPTNSLDQNGIQQIRQIIEKERDRGALVLLASHNMEDICLLSDQIFTMKDGGISSKNQQ